MGGGGMMSSAEGQGSGGSSPHDHAATPEPLEPRGGPTSGDEASGGGRGGGAALTASPSIRSLIPSRPLAPTADVPLRELLKPSTGGGVGRGGGGGGGGGGRSDDAASVARRRREEVAASVVQRTQTLAAIAVKNGYVPGAIRTRPGEGPPPASRGRAGPDRGGGGTSNKLSGSSSKTGQPRRTGGKSISSKATGAGGFSAGGGAGRRQQLSPEAVKAVQEKHRAEKREMEARFSKYRFQAVVKPRGPAGSRESGSSEDDGSRGGALLAREAPVPHEQLDDVPMMLETGWKFQRVRED